MKILKALILFFILGYLFVPHAFTAEEGEQETTTSHGIALFGDLKYGPDFKHFDYVNPDAPKGGEYRYGGAGSLNNLNPYALTGSIPMISIYQGLMVGSEDEPTSLYGLIAESVTYPKDFSWVEFKLRENARWHDGIPITPEDVIFTAETFKTKGGPVYRNLFKNVEKVEKTGPYSVRFFFDESIVDNNMGHGIAAAAPVLPKHYWQNRDITKPSIEIPLMGGPYKIKKLEVGRYIVMERVEDYWGRDLPVNKGRYNFDTIRIDVYRDLSIAFEAFLAGKVDFRMETQPSNWISGYDIPAARDGWIVKERLKTKNFARYMGIYFNNRREKFRDPKVREAISYAFDWEWINKNIYHSFYVRLRSYFDNSELANQGLPGPEELKLLEPYKDQLDPRVFTQVYMPPSTDGSQASLRKNLRKASQLLKEAGYVNLDGRLISSKGKPLEIELLLWDPSIERMYSSLVANLKVLGIDAHLRLIESSQVTRRMRTYDYDMMSSFAISLSLHPSSSEHTNYWSSKSAEREGGLNYMGINSPVVDALIENLDLAKNRAEKVTAVRALDRVLVWGFYSIPVHYSPEIHIAYWNRFGKPETTPEWTRYLMTIIPYNWWIDKEKDAALTKARGFK